MNELLRAGGRTRLRIVLDVLREPMLALLLAAGAIFFVLGDRTEALILVAFARLSIATRLSRKRKPSESAWRACRAVCAGRARWRDRSHTRARRCRGRPSSSRRAIVLLPTPSCSKLMRWMPTLVVLPYGLLRGGCLAATLAGIAIGMSLLPEEFAVVLTIFLAMGAWRIAKVGVLTRRTAAIETLGAATVLCTDKTGTLTRNRMTVTGLTAIRGQSRAFPRHQAISAIGPKERRRRLMALVESGRIVTNALVTHGYRLNAIEDANELFAAQRDGVTKVAVTPQAGMFKVLWPNMGPYSARVGPQPEA